jgi:DNA modification methylase
MNKIEFGDCRETMRKWASEGVKAQTCVTSPPYYGLRDYGTGKWIGGDETCSHKRDSKYSDKTITGHANKELTVGDAIYKSVCPKCGAVREDRQLGLEETPEEYIKAMVEVFRCVWDVLEDDGTLWVNIGDSYYNYRPGKGQSLVQQSVANNNQDLPQTCARRGNKLEGLKEKDLIGIPWMLAFALRADGWYLRQDIIWHKPNPMPESVGDRCTKAHEYIFLMSKSKNYYYDRMAIAEPAAYAEEHARKKTSWGTKKAEAGVKANIEKYQVIGSENKTSLEGGMANKRSVWSVPVKPYSEAHFAVFPTELIEPCILAGAPVGGIVLDPFMGSGTTAQVAQDLGRQYIGCELNPKYEKLQKKRTAQTSLDFA